ncbi:MAG: FG-GAP repeat protein [Bacteriovoracaceae bacterium]
MKNYLFILITLILSACGLQNQKTAKIEVSRNFVLSSSLFGGLIVKGEHESGKTFTISIDNTFSRALTIETGKWTLNAIGWDGTTGNFSGLPYCGSSTLVVNSSTQVIDISINNANCSSDSSNIQSIKTLTCGTNKELSGTSFSTISASTSDTYCTNLPDSTLNKLDKFMAIKYVATEIVNGNKSYPFESACISTIPTLSTLKLPTKNFPIAIKTYASAADCTNNISAALFEFPQGIENGNGSFDSIFHTSINRLVLPTQDSKRWEAPVDNGWVPEAYVIASNTDTNDSFGTSVSLYGNTMAAGAPFEDSGQTTITNGSTASVTNTLTDSGAVYVYSRSGTTWTQQAYIKAVNADLSDYFGISVTLDKDTLAVGAYTEDSNETSITNGNAASADNTSSSSGAVYVYKRTGSSWAQEAYIKAANANASDSFGTDVTLNGDTLVVGAPGEDSNQTTITNGVTASADNTSSGSGAVYVYKRVGSTWSQEAYIKASNNGASDGFGTFIDIDGDTLIVGVPNEDSNQTSITNGATASSDNSASSSGAVYVYRRTSAIWAQEAYIKASNAETADSFGSSLVLSGNLIAVGSPLEDSNQTTITNGATSSSDNSLASSGAVYIYKRTGSSWAQEAFIKPSNSDSNDNFGSRVALSGYTLAISSINEDSNQTLITDGPAASNTLTDSGAVYVYQRNAGIWSIEAYIKADNAGATDNFGSALAISGDTLVVGAKAEDGTSNSITNAGAVYVYRNTSRLFEAHQVNATSDDASISLTWAHSGGTNSNYIIDFVEGATPPADCSAGVTLSSSTTSYTISGLNSLTNYSIRICATDGTLISEGIVLSIDTL